MFAGIRRRDLAFGAASLIGLLGWTRSAPRAARHTVQIADMTWIEVRDAITEGFRTAIVPSGGLEQNGPQLIIGKHDDIVRWAARRIAAQLGNALVTPVVSFVPEGDFNSPSGNYDHPGTIGVTPAVYEGVLDGIARSLKLAGFTAICFIADHGGSVASQAVVASRLQSEWKDQGIKVVDVTAYYADTAEDNLIRAQGEPEANIGQHAAIADTAELMAVRPDGVDLSQVPNNLAELQRLGGSGDPRRATFARGDALMALKVDGAVRQIRAALAQG